MTPIEFKLDDDFLEDLFLKDDKESMRLLKEKVINAILKAEATEQIGASRYARSEGRITYRNGYRIGSTKAND